VQIEHWRILEVLSDEHGRSMGELAELVLMNHPRSPRPSIRMVSSGFVHRRADAQDSRRVLVYITDHGPSWSGASKNASISTINRSTRRSGRRRPSS
jgi:DNA-binding MarR family transcriptional regulator